MGIIQDMLQRRWAKQDAAEWSAELPGLLGRAGTGEILGEQFGPALAGLESTGYGLMQDPGDVDNQMRFLQGVSDLPGGGQWAANQAMGVGAREDAQTADLGFLAQQHTNALQQDSQTNFQDLLKASITRSIAMGGLGGGLYDDTAQYQQVLNQTRAAAANALKVSGTMLDIFDNTNQSIIEAGGLLKINPAQEETMLRGWMKTMVPGSIESFMSDDRMAVELQNLGFGDMAEAWLNRQSGKRIFSDTALQNMFGSMVTNVGQSKLDNDAIRQQFGATARDLNLPSSQVMRDRPEFAPWQAEQAPGSELRTEVRQQIIDGGGEFTDPNGYTWTIDPDTDEIVTVDQ